MYSVNNKLKKGFYLYNKTHDLDSISGLLEIEFIDLSGELYEKTGKKYDVAFYSAEGINLYRSWSTLKGDDSKHKKEIIRSALKTVKTTSG